MQENCKPFGTPLGFLTIIRMKKKGYYVTQLWEVVLELCMAPNDLLDISLVTNLQKTNKQKFTGNAAKSDKISKKNC
jgi:hypothetical protein